MDPNLEGNDGTVTHMDREKYRRDICDALAHVACCIPLMNVRFESGAPQIGECHQNVDRYVLENRGFTAVRGWVTIPSLGTTARAAHSVVMSPDGDLFDITPFADERERHATRFVPHVGDDQSFKDEREFQPLFHCDCPNDSHVRELDAGFSGTPIQPGDGFATFEGEAEEEFRSD